MLSHIYEDLRKQGQKFDPSAVADILNRRLVVNAMCDAIFCPFDDELFDAGPDREGSAIGGPIWTDFSVLELAADKHRFPKNIVQIVGHTLPRCYRDDALTSHTNSDDNKCDEHLIRHTEMLSAICVDAGMFLGARAYLELNQDAAVTAFEELTTTYYGDKKRLWSSRRLDTKGCTSRTSRFNNSQPARFSDAAVREAFRADKVDTDAPHPRYEETGNNDNIEVHPGRSEVTSDSKEPSEMTPGEGDLAEGEELEDMLFDEFL
jgi:hypothetical protein